MSIQPLLKKEVMEGQGGQGGHQNQNVDQFNFNPHYVCHGCNQEYCACGQGETPWVNYEGQWFPPSSTNYWTSDYEQEQQRIELNSKGHSSKGHPYSNSFYTNPHTASSPEAFLPSDIFNLESANRFPDNQQQQYHFQQPNCLHEENPYTNPMTSDDPPVDPFGHFLYPYLTSHVSSVGQEYQPHGHCYQPQSTFSGHQVTEEQQQHQYLPVQQFNSPTTSEFWSNSHRPLLS